MAKLGVKRLIYTDIKRDGTLSEPNYDGVEEMVGGVKAKIIAAGGISELEHLWRLAKLGWRELSWQSALYRQDRFEGGTKAKLKIKGQKSK